MQRGVVRYALTVVSVAIGIAAGGIVDSVTSGAWPAWMTVVSLVAVVGAVSLWDWWREHRLSRPHPSPTPVPAVPDWVVDRPAELEDVVAKVCDRPGGPVGITTALRGAGGFGKTTLARLVAADKRVRRRFGGRVYDVTIGRDVLDPAAIAGKVNDAIELVTGTRPGLTDPASAGQRLGQVLDDGSPLLLILDDVWDASQLAPFLIGGRGCVRLVTTRVAQVLPATAATVLVDRLSPEQARAVLLWELTGLAERTIRRLLEVTGGWPLLLRLVNRILHDANRVGHRLNDRAENLVERLTAGGPSAVDHLFSGAPTRLDVNVPQERARAVRATIEASSLHLRSDGDRARLLELGVFAEDEPVPVRLVEQLWAATAGTDPADAARLCQDLDRLALVTLGRDSTGSAVLTMHDVIRSHLRAELGEDRLRALNSTLLDAVAADLPAAPSLLRAPSAEPAPAGPAWWSLPDTERYLWNNLAFHFGGAGRSDRFDVSIADLRWVAARLTRWGPASPIADLAHGGTARTTALRGKLIQHAHLLGPTDPAHAVVDILLDRLRGDHTWRAEAEAIQATAARARLVGRVPARYWPGPAIRRTLTGHNQAIETVAIAPDGTWLASASGTGDIVRMWRTDSDAPVRYFDHSAVRAIAVAPDGTWLVTGGYGDEVRQWDVATGDLLGQVRVTAAASVSALAVTPDGRLFASGTSDAVLRLWDARTLELVATLDTSLGAVEALAFTPDGRWLVAGGYHGLVMWEPDSGAVRSLTTDWVTAIAIDPEGRWLATADHGYMFRIRLWNPRTGEVTRTIDTDGQEAASLAAAPDGTWLAAGMEFDGRVRVWDTRNGALRATLSGHTGTVGAATAAPDGSWLATGGDDRTVRLWSMAADPAATTLSDTGGVTAVAVAPDSTWLVTGDPSGARTWQGDTGAATEAQPTHRGPVHAVAIAPDGTWFAAVGDVAAALWNPVTGACRAELTGHVGAVRAVAIAPDGGWLATGADDGTLRLWDARTGSVRAVLTGHTGPVLAVAIAPDGRWLASGGEDATVRLWRADRTGEGTVLTGHQGAVRAIAIAPDGTWLAAGGDDPTVRMRRLVQGDTPAITECGPVQSMAIAPDGQWLATVGHDGRLRRWDSRTGMEQNAFGAGYRGAARAVAIAPDGSWLAIAGDHGVVLMLQQLDRIARPVRAKSVAELAVAPDTTWLATGGHDQSVWLWNPATGVPHRMATESSRMFDWILALVLAPDGSWLATGDSSGKVLLWEFPSGRCRAKLTGHTLSVRALAVARDGTWLASGGEDGTVRLWEAPTGEPGPVWRAHTGPVNAIAIAPDGTWLVSGGEYGKSRDDPTLVVWDVVTGSARASLNRPVFESVAISHDGTWFIAGTDDGLIMLYTPNCQPLGVLKGHTRTVNALAVSPDGARLASAGEDGTLWIWDLTTRRCLTLIRTDTPLLACVWMPSGNAVAVTTGTGLSVFDLRGT